MVNSKGGSSSILILFSGMKSTSKFPTLTSKAIVGCFLPFSKIRFSGLHWYSMAITYSQRLRDRGGGCEILFAKTSLKIDKFSLSFSTLFLDFSLTCKSISQQKLFVRALFRNTLSFLNV